MLAGGRKGHLALVDMMNMNLIKEIQVGFNIIIILIMDFIYD